MIQPPPGFTLDASPSSPFQNPPSPADSELRPLSPVPPPPGFEVDDAPLSEAEARVRLKLDRSEKKPGLLSDAYNLAKSGVASLIGGVGRLAHELTPDSSVAVNPHEDMSGGLNIPPGYGKRVDGTDKGDGYLGPIRRDDGKTMTELSIGMDFGQGEQEVPAIVPTLTPDEVEYLRRGGDPLRNEAIMRKAGDHARERLAAGKSPFADPEEIPQGNVEMPGLAMSKWAQREQQRIFEKLTPEQRDAMQRIEQFDAADSSTYGNLFKNPRGVYGMMVQSAPMMLPGMAAARASIALGGGVKAAAAAAAAAEGTIGGVVGGDQIAQMIEGATAEELAQSPRYQELLAESGDPERAKAALASELYGWGALSTGALTAILGAPAGAIYGRMFGGEAAQSLFGNMARGAVTESLEEAGQSGAETLVQNAAAQQSIDPNRKISEDVGTNMMVGAAAAAPMGAGFGALAPTAPGKTAPSPQPATPPPPAAPPADPGIVVNDVTPDPIVAPPPPEPATRGEAAALELQDELIAARERPGPLADVTERPIEKIELAPPPADTPDSNIDVQTSKVERIEAAPEPVDTPDSNIDVKPLKVDRAELAPEPVDRPDSNIDVNEARVTPIEAAPAPESDEQAAHRANAERMSQTPDQLPDSRLTRPDYRRNLEQMAGDLVKGGNIALIGGDFSQVNDNVARGKETPVQRTPSENPAWFKSLTENKDTKVTVEQAKKAVVKALRGDRLGVREARVVESMLDEISGQRSEEADRLREARALRQQAAESIGITDADVAQAGQLFDEPEYDADWDAETRSLHELASAAAEINPETAQNILESGLDNNTAARRFAEIINDRTARESAQETAGESGEGPLAETQGGAATSGNAAPQRDANPSEVIAPYTATDLAEREQQIREGDKARKAAEAKADADEQASNFNLAGSDTEADQAAARGQQDLLSAKAKSLPDKSDRPIDTPDPRIDTGDRIEDFGETLHGARKHYAEALSDKMREAQGLDIATEPLAKTWPEPNYQKLIDEGADPWLVGFVRAARDEVPNRPRRRGALGRYVQQVSMLRDTSAKLLSGEISTSKLREMLAEKEFSNLRDNIGGRADLYVAVGHDMSLKGIKVRSGSYTFLNGKKYDPPKTFWTVEKRAKKTAFSNWPNEMARGTTKNDAIAAFKDKVEQGEFAKEQKPERQIRFDIYSKRGERGKFFIGKKIGKDYVDLKSFDDVKAARKYLLENKDDLAKRLARFKTIPAHRRDTNAPRVGTDHRNGADASPEMFADAFGFRGVQFGNYVEGKRRQQDLNESYDALMDLAGVLGVPPRALSLNGELGLAFGARGHGGKRAPSAHYEPGTVVINLTKRSGAGSLAHEWFHSLDNYFSRTAGDSTGYATGGGRTDGVRPAVVEAFQRIKSAIQSIGLMERSKQLDKRRTKAYWSTDIEMTARSFESYVIAKLADQNQANDYLANVVSEEAFGDEAEYPYPTAGEIPAIREAYDHFFETVETRETDSGVGFFAVRSTPRESWSRTETAQGPMLANDDFTLFPAGVPFAGLYPSGSVVYTIVDTKTGKGVGSFVGGMDELGEIDTIYSIVIDDKGKGVGSRIVRAIVANSTGPVTIDNILSSAVGFWQKIGMYDYDGTNAKIDRESFTGAGGKAARGASRKSQSTETDGRNGSVPQEAGSRGSETEQVRSYLESKAGKGAIKRVVDSGKFRIAQSASDADAPPEVRRAARDGSTIYGYHDPDTGTSWLFADSLNTTGTASDATEDAYAIFLHEVGVHFGMRDMLGDKLFDDVVAAVEKAADGKLTSAFAQAARAARAAVPEGTPASQVAEETVAWLVTDAANHKLHWVKRIIAKIRAFLVKRGFTKALSTDALVELARGAARKARGARNGGFFASAWHGSPHHFDEFSTDNIGTGEGAQAYGYGLYFAENKRVAEEYRRALSGDPQGQEYVVSGRNVGGLNRLKSMSAKERAAVYKAVYGDKEAETMLLYDNYSDSISHLNDVSSRDVEIVEAGSIYHVDIPDSVIDRMLDWDAPLSEQPETVQSAIEAALQDDKVFEAWKTNGAIEQVNGGLLYNRIVEKLGPAAGGTNGAQGAQQKAASDLLRKTGVPGIKYLDGGSRASGEGTRNFVVFDAKDVTILARNGEKLSGRNKADAIDELQEQHPETNEAGKFARERRKYTPEQQAAIDAGKFGAVEKGGLSRQSVKDGIERFRKKWRQGVVDQFDSLRSVLNDNRAWMMAQLSKSDSGALEAIIGYGSPELVEGALSIKKGTKGLGDILQPLGAEMDDFLRWIAGHRADRLSGEGREHLFDADQIAALKSLNQGTMPDGRNRAEVYESVRKEFEALSDAVVGVAVDTGLIAPEQREQWLEEGFYVPFYRMSENDDGARRGPGIATGLAKQRAYKKLKGADIPLNDLLTNVLMNWHHLIGASLRNQAAAKAMEAATSMGLAEKVNESQKSKNAIWINEDGNKQWYEFDQTEEAALVLDSLLSLSWEGLNGIGMRAGRAMKRALTIGVTVSPEFRVANLLRDTIHSVAVADMDVNIVKNVASGWKGTRRGSETQVAMLAGGGAFGTSGYIDGADPEAVKRLVKKGVDEDTILTTAARLGKVWDWYQEWGARAENINRAAAYKTAIERGADNLEANFAARDLLDFSRTGSFVAVRAVAQLVPFLNARLQGLDKMGRAVANKKQRAQFAAVTAVYSIASVLMYLQMRDDDDYKEAEQWERDAYHLFKLPGSDVMYRFPRPFEVGTIATIMERITEQAVDDDVHGELFAERLWHALTETLAFNPIPQIVKPAVEVFANRSMFTGNSIESMSMERLSPSERKRAWTSETAVQMSAGMDEVSFGKVVLSPVQIEHLVRGYLGWGGAFVLGAVDTLFTRPLTGAPEDPAKKFYEAPVMKRFVRSNPTRHSKYVSTFYDQLRSVNQIYADAKQAEKLGELAKMDKLLDEHGDMLTTRKYLNRVSRRLSKISAEMTLVYSDREMDAEAKRKAMDELLKARNKIARDVVTDTRKFFR